MASIIEEQIKKLETRLDVVECGQSLNQQLHDIKLSNTVADTKWNVAFGITVMLIAYDWLNDSITSNDLSARVIGVLGILLILWVLYAPLIARLWRKIRSKGSRA